MTSRGGKQALEIYVHIPFCVKKCAYCDFLSAPSTEAEREAYVELLCREIEACGGLARQAVTSVFFGGGTPSLLTGEQVARILGALRRWFAIDADAEITLEANPGTVTQEKLREYYKSGVNRLSVGLQSVHDEELRLLGRIHTYADFLETYRLARDAGFRNINVDLISAIPGQTLARWEETLRTVTALEPEHISAYSLIIEPGTPFGEIYGAEEEAEEEDAHRTEKPLDAGYCAGSEQEMPERRAGTGPICGSGQELREQDAGGCTEQEMPDQRAGAGSMCGSEQERDATSCQGPGTFPPLPDEEEERLMYRRTREILEEAGYLRYEISNYARPGFACRHNLGYWDRVPYLGFGVGAASLFDHARYTNPADLDSYRASFLEKLHGEALTPEEEREEFLFLGLRKTRGIETAEFARQFGQTPGQIYGRGIRRLKALGMLEEAGGFLRLTERGIDVSNAVFAELLTI